VSKIGLEHAKKFVDLLTPDSQAEKLVFRRFPGEVLQAASVAGTAVPKDKITTVTLKINPKSLQFAKRKVIQKVQTSAPNRFIVFDWGHELTVLGIDGVTGNLLPDSLTKGVLDPVADATMDVLSWSPGTQEAVSGSNAWKTAHSQHNLATGNSAANFVNKEFNGLMLGTLKYSELLDLSPKYKTFKRLEHMYDVSDADNDIITLELADTIYRGFFEEFSFSVVAENPWNWSYSLTYIILENISESISKSDEKFSNIDAKAD
jgi:hypothetical protein